MPNPARSPPDAGAGVGAVGGGDTGWGSIVSWIDAHPLRPETPRSPSNVTLTNLGITPSPDGNEER